MGIKKRKKASEVLKDTNFVIAKKGTFAETFPEIKSATVQVTEKGSFRSHSIQSKNCTYSEKNLGEYIDCNNPFCYNGGFSICNIVRDMVKDNKTHDESTEICQGYKGSPKGKRNYGRCTNTWKVIVDLEYFS